MFPCQIAGLQIKLHVQQIFHYEPTKCTTAAAVGFFIYVVYGFKNSQEKKSALMYPKTSCILFRKEQHDFCQHCTVLTHGAYSDTCTCKAASTTNHTR